MKEKEGKKMKKSKIKLCVDGSLLDAIDQQDQMIFFIDKKQMVKIKIDKKN
jgi:hypothetical protein